MSLRNSVPIPWKPRGLSDTLYSGTSFPGAMATLTNLIPDPTSADLWQCRPAAIERADPDGDFPAPGFVSALLIVGTRIYGMMSTSTNPGNDEPFCFDIILQTYIAITGADPANTPISATSTGAWVPPHMEVVGTYIVVTHTGFSGVAGAFFGLIDISDPNALTWTATNTAINALPAVPQWVAQYNGRACFFVNPAIGQGGLYMSDSLVPATITDAGQILTFGDNVPITCGVGLPLNNQLGGIIASLIVFKGASNLYQVTGDFSTTDLAVNSLNVATGTLAPNSLSTTPYGLAFISPEGLRVISFTAQVSDPIGVAGSGVTVPFSNAVVPSRIAAAYAGTIYRVSVKNGYATGTPEEDYWYDFARKIWHGPHTFPASLLLPYQNTFFLTPLGSTDGRIFQNDTAQTNSSTYIEDGTQMSWAYRPPFFPNTDQMAQNAMVETTLYMALAAGAPVTIQAQNDANTLLDSLVLSPASSSTIWGAFLWGTGVWQGAQDVLTARQLPWTVPIVFQRMTIHVEADSAPGIKIGTLNMRYEQLGYLLPVPS